MEKTHISTNDPNIYRVTYHGVKLARGVTRVECDLLVFRNAYGDPNVGIAIVGNRKGERIRRIEMNDRLPLGFLKNVDVAGSVIKEMYSSAVLPEFDELIAVIGAQLAELRVEAVGDAMRFALTIGTFRTSVIVHADNVRSFLVFTQASARKTKR